MGRVTSNVVFEGVPYFEMVPDQGITVRRRNSQVERHKGSQRSAQQKGDIVGRGALGRNVSIL
jgi:hypothetical protein